MKSMSYARLAVLVIVCVWCPNALGQDVRRLSIGSTAEYLDQQADLNLGASSVSPVNGHVFQAVLSKSDEEGSGYRFYIWELTADGKKVHEWLVYEGTSEVTPMPSYLFPDLHVLPTGEILAVIMDESGIPAIAKLDARGRNIFTRPLTENRRRYPLFRRIMPAPGGQAFVLGQLRGKPAIVKTDEQGQILFEKEIKVEGDGICSDGVQLSDNRFRICGISQDGIIFRGSRSWVVDVDSQGEVQKQFLFANAAPASLPGNHRLVNLDSGQTAVVHPVTAEGKTYCYLTVFDDALKKIDEIKLCEVPEYVGSFEVQRYDKGLVIAVVSSPRKISLYVLDEQLKVRAVGDTEGLLPGGPLRYRLAIADDRALVLVQKGSPLPNDRDSIECGVIDLKVPPGSVQRSRKSSRDVP